MRRSVRLAPAQETKSGEADPKERERSWFGYRVAGCYGQPGGGRGSDGPFRDMSAGAGQVSYPHAMW